MGLYKTMLPKNEMTKKVDAILQEIMLGEMYFLKNDFSLNMECKVIRFDCFSNSLYHDICVYNDTWKCWQLSSSRSFLPERVNEQEAKEIIIDHVNRTLASAEKRMCQR